MPQTNVRMSVPPWTRWVKILTIAHVVLYILWLAFGRWQAAPVLAEEIVLLPKSLWDGHVWQLYTYTFAQMEPQTLLFAGLALWMFGGDLESRWGSRRFLTFYFTVIAIGALLLCVLALGVPALFGLPVVGLGGFVLGVIVAWGLTYPDREILFMFVLPLKGRHVMLLALGVDALYAFATTPMVFVIHAFCAVVAASLVALWRRYGGLFASVRMLWARLQAKRRRRHLRAVKDEPRGPTFH